MPPLFFGCGPGPHEALAVESPRPSEEVVRDHLEWSVHDLISESVVPLQRARVTVHQQSATPRPARRRRREERRASFEASLDSVGGRALETVWAPLR